jgi:serine protease AprX
MRHYKLLPLLAGLAVALSVPLAAGADSGSQATDSKQHRAHVSSTLLAAAQANTHASFRVIVQGRRYTSSTNVGQGVSATVAQHPGDAAGTTKKFVSISAVAAELTGEQILTLAQQSEILAITEDAPVRLTGGGDKLSNKQKWPRVADVTTFWSSKLSKLEAPAIAIVDSGIDASRPDFGGRVVAEVDLTSLEPNSSGDGRGHGTFVASIAAGSAAKYAGAAPNAKLVSVDVVGDDGVALTSDVIRGADWIIAHKDAYNIRVANFSLHGTLASSFMLDPLDKAVERLWFSGIVVVAAAGNQGVNGRPSRVLFAPANDPFVITVGATDIMDTVSAKDDVAAPWSVYGYTADGFAKPELSAPGRYMVGAIPPGSTLAAERGGKMVEDGYMQLSGTSFAAPVVAGAAANLLAAHPDWTPDQVKGALMLKPRPTPNAAPFSTGVGEVRAAKAVKVDNPPNPNASLNAFLVPDPEGGPRPMFDAAAWTDIAKANVSWDSAAWTDAAWNSAAWTDAAWTDAAWTDAAFASAAWTDDMEEAAAWNSAAWNSAAWNSAAWTDVLAEMHPAGGYWLGKGDEKSEEDDND